MSERLEYWRPRIERASNASFLKVRRSIRRELSQVADDFAVGRYSQDQHRARTEDLLARTYADVGHGFLVLGREMVADKLFRETADVLFSQRVAELIRTVGPTRARRIAAKTNRTVTAVLAEAAEQGLGERETARLIRARVAESRMALARARTIARTEIGAAQNAGIISAADEIGVAVNLTWITIMDGRERPTHAAVNETTIAPGQKFQVGSALLAHPGDPDGPPEEIINCRCTTLLTPV